MTTCRYLLLGVEADGDGPIHAALYGPGSRRVRDAYLNKMWTTPRPGEFMRRLALWGDVEAKLAAHMTQPLLVQERIVRNILGLEKGEPKPLGYFCSTCSMFHQTDPKEIVVCKKCKREKCPAAGCR